MKKYKSIGLHIANEQSCSTGLPLCVPMVFNMEEIWKDVIGYEGLYQVSNLGRVKSLDRYYIGVWKTPVKMNGIILNPKFHKHYLHVNISVNGNLKRFSIHRLVAIAFIPNHENKPFVNHKDGNKLNNCVSNLEWCTPKENDIHASAMGLKAFGERNGYHKLTNDLVKEIRGKYIPRIYTNKMLAAEYNMSYHEIQLINLGKRWSRI